MKVPWWRTCDNTSAQASNMFCSRPGIEKVVDIFIKISYDLNSSCKERSLVARCVVFWETVRQGSKPVRDTFSTERRKSIRMGYWSCKQVFLNCTRSMYKSKLLYMSLVCVSNDRFPGGARVTTRPPKRAQHIDNFFTLASMNRQIASRRPRKPRACGAFAF